MIPEDKNPVCINFSLPINRETIPRIKQINIQCMAKPENCLASKKSGGNKNNNDIVAMNPTTIHCMDSENCCLTII